MKFSKSIVALALATTFFVSCKKNETNAPDSTEASAKKEIAAAVKPETASFTIDGMTCPEGCAKTIEKNYRKWMAFKVLKSILIKSKRQ